MGNRFGMASIRPTAGVLALFTVIAVAAPASAQKLDNRLETRLNTNPSGGPLGGPGPGPVQNTLPGPLTQPEADRPAPPLRADDQLAVGRPVVPGIVPLPAADPNAGPAVEAPNPSNTISPSRNLSPEIK